jgi:hypothetical protein
MDNQDLLKLFHEPYSSTRTEKTMKENALKLGQELMKYTLYKAIL